MCLPTPHLAIPRVEPNSPHNCHCGWNEEEPNCARINEKSEHHGCRGKEFGVEVRSAEHCEIVLPDVRVETHRKRGSGRECSGKTGQRTELAPIDTLSQ